MKKLLFAVSLFSLFFVTSCKNFLNGGDFLVSLDEAIAYNSEPFITVQISSDINAIKSIEPSNGTYKNEYKNTSKIKLNVLENDGYQFTKWEVIPEEAVEFSSSENKTTTALINTQEEEIKIYPAIYERPAVISFSPSNLVIQPKNSAISIDFNKKLYFSEDDITSNLSNFTIIMGGLDIRSYFQTPTIVENSDGNTRIIFAVDRNNMIPLTSTEATITVTIPENLYYVSDNGYNIYSEKSFTYSYTINNQTLDYIDIEFIEPENQASLNIKDTKRYYLDEEFSLVCEPIPGYQFTDWKIVTNYNTETETPIESNLLIIDTSDFSKLKAKVLCGSTTPVTIIPIMEVSKTIFASFTGKKGKLNQSDSKNLYPNDKFTLSFTEDNEFYFSKWSIWDKDNNKYLTETEIKQILDFDITKYEQQITVLNLEKNYNLEFIAETLSRPKIISKSPVISPEGAYRDSTIQIMFDHAMNADSIYFTQAEFDEIYAKNNKAATAVTTTIKDNNNNNVDKIYCYYLNKGTANEEKFYKNITITNYKTGANLNSCFGIPYFESSNVLLIPVIDDNNKKPNPGLKIQVTISGDFNYTDSEISRTKSNPVTMSNNDSWVYEVNDKTDDKKPVFAENIKIQNIVHNENEFQVKTATTTTLEKKLTTNETKVTNFLYLNNSKTLSFNLSVSLNDSESGPSSIEAVIYNFDTNSSYTYKLETITNGTEIFYGKYDYSQTPADFLPEIVNLSLPNNFSIEGENTIQFIGKDKTGNKILSENYHFYYTENRIQLDEPTLIDSNYNKLTIEWNKPQNDYFDKVIIEYKLKNDENYKIKEDLSTNDLTTTINENDIIEFKIYPKDIFGFIGNVQTFNINNRITGFKLSSNLESPETSIDISWNKPESDIDYYILYFYKNGNGFSDGIRLDKNLTSYTLENLESMTGYLIVLYGHKIYNKKTNSTIRFGANANYSTSVKPVENLKATINENNKIVLSWDNPLNYDSNVSMNVYRCPGDSNGFVAIAAHNTVGGNTALTFDTTSYEDTKLDSYGYDWKYKIITRYYSSFAKRTVESKSTILYCSNPVKFLSYSASQNINNPTSQIDINFEKKFGYADGLYIKYKLDSETDEDWKLLTEYISEVGVLRTTGNYTVKNLIPDTNYNFKLIPFKTNGVTGINYESTGYILTCSTASEASE